MSYLGKSPAPVVAGGTGNASFATTHAPICTGTSATNPLELASTGLATAGFVLTSNGSAATPSFQAASASGSVTDLTGNSGGAVAPTAGNINVVGDGTTVTIAGNPGTSTLTVSTTGASLTGYTNPNSGSDPTGTALGVLAGVGITSGSANTALGFASLQHVTSGTNNIGIANSSGEQLVSGNYNVLIGVQAGLNYTGSESNNVIIGSGIPGVTSENNVLRIASSGGQAATSAYIGGIAGVSVSNTNMVVINTATGQLGSQAVPVGGITTVDGDTGTPVTASTINIYGQTGSANCGSSVLFNGASASELDLVVTDGNLNTIIGAGAGVIPNTASSCTALGAQALASITDDDSHVAIGRGALQNANDGSSNTAVGAYALNSVVAAGDNTAIGAHAGINMPNGNFNTMLGYFSGTNYVGAESSNILIGNAGVAAENNTIRIGDTGSGALQQNQCFLAGVAGVTVSNLNVVTIDTTTGQLGSQASGGGGITTVDGDVGSVTGSTISLLAQTGSADCGSSVLFNASSATELDLVVTDSGGNTIVGQTSGTPSSGGGSTQCTGFGGNVFQAISADSTHCAVGYGALQNCSGSFDNTAIGWSSLNAVSTGNSNTALGSGSLPALLTGNFNICIGVSSGNNYATSESNNIVIGSNVLATPGESNALHIGDTGTSALTTAFIGGIYGVNTANPVLATIDSVTNQLGSVSGVVAFPGGIATAPASSNTATTAFGASLTAGTSVQNTLGYDILLNISVVLSVVAVAGTVTLGVGPATGPTADPVTATLAAATSVSFCAIVPQNYWVVVNTTGTITVGSITVQACPL